MSKAIRDVYGEALLKYGAQNPDLVVLDADVSSSTKTAGFGAAFPERFFNVGIAEANMCAMAAGLARAGKIPFVNTFAVFISSIGLLAARAYGSYSKLPLKLMGAYGGISDAFDGPSHHALEDIAIMRALPNFKVYVAGSAVQTDWLVRHAIEDASPMYIRLSRDAMAEHYAPGTDFADGKGMVLREGCDLSIIACGLMTGNAMEAARLLEKEGISARVVDMFCIKPLDVELLCRCAKETGAIVSAEEHNVIGGLGSAVAEALLERGAAVPFARVGLQDCHTECGPYAALQAKYGLNPEAIVEKAREVLKRK